MVISLKFLTIYIRVINNMWNRILLSYLYLQMCIYIGSFLINWIISLYIYIYKTKEDYNWNIHFGPWPICPSPIRPPSPILSISQCSLPLCHLWPNADLPPPPTGKGHTQLIYCHHPLAKATNQSEELPSPWMLSFNIWDYVCKLYVMGCHKV